MEQQPAKKQPPEKLVTFVCTGNTCRSPIAEALFNSRLKARGIEGISATSAGIFASPVRSTASYSVEALKELGISISPAKARRLDEELVKKSDCVITMTEAQKDALLAKFSILYHPKIMSINEITSAGDIDDPYSEDKKTYLEIAKKLNSLTDSLIDYIIS